MKNNSSYPGKDYDDITLTANYEMQNMLGYIASTGCSSGAECCFREAEAESSILSIPIQIYRLKNSE